MKPRTIIEKLWDSHVVHQQPGAPALLYIDLHLVHEVTSPQAFEGLRQRGLKVRRPDLTFATADHSIPTTDRTLPIVDQIAARQVQQLEINCRQFGIPHEGIHGKRQGIVHVIGPEQGATLPGMTVVCGDSHTSTHGALGALAFGIGTSEVEHVLATQTMLVKKASNFLVRIEGQLCPGVGAKDVVLALIGRIGTAGATGSAIEFGGDTVQNLSIESRMTLCNMSIEAGARAGMVAVDQHTIDYVHGRRFAPIGSQWEAAVAHWHGLRSDPGARFDRVVSIDASQLAPQVSWGTSPEMVSAIGGAVPDPACETDAVRRSGIERALEYMGLTPGLPITDIRIDKVFIGSCTNSRIEDLREAARVVRGRRVAASVRQAMVVPGSGMVKAQAEAEGLDRVFLQAGFEWREPGCSMCLGMNDDRLGPGERCASTSNRDFEGRQGPGGRTHLVSPAMAAAAALAGRFVDVRQMQ